MSDSPVTLEFIGRTMLAMQAGMREMRHELRDVRSLSLATVDQVRRVDRHVVEKQVGELRDRMEELETGKSRFAP